MCVQKHLLFGILWAFALFLAVPFTAQAASSSYSNSFDFGVIPGYPAMDNAGGVEPVLEAGISGGGGMDLGCAGIDIFSYIETTFNFNFNVDRFVNNLKTKVAKWALTQMMATPQIAAVFDTLNQMENFRWDMFNENCNIEEIKEDAKAQFVKYCSKQPGMDEIQCQEKYDTQSTGYLKQAANVFKGILESIGSMDDVLPGTNFCKGPNGQENGSVCGLMGFLPTMRFCHTSSTGAGLGCAKVGDIDIGDTPLGFPFLLDAATAVFGEKVYNANGGLIEQMAANLGMDEMGLLARRAEAAGAPPAPAISTLNKLSKEYVKFVGCSNWDPLAQQRQLASLSGGSYAVPAYSAYKTEVEGILDSSGLQSGLASLKAADAKEVKEMLVVAVGCVANHEIHLDTSTELSLLQKPRPVREEFRQAVAMRASVRMVERVLTFVKSKVDAAASQIGTESQSAEKRRPTYFMKADCKGTPLTDTEVELRKLAGVEMFQCDDLEVDKYVMTRDAFKILQATLEKMQVKLRAKEKDATWWANMGKALNSN